MKVGIIHATYNAIPPLNEAFNELAPEIEVLNFMNENLQYYANQIGYIDDKIHRDFYDLGIMAQEAEVEIIIVACTVLTPIIQTLNDFIKIPIIAVDRPMLEEVVKNFNKVGVVATNAPSAPETEKQLKNIAENTNRQIEVETQIETNAMKELKAGNISKHNNMNYYAAKKLVDKGCEAIVLAQITQASAEKETKKTNLPVFTSPQSAVKATLEILKKRE